jgi:hypothetical protein
MDVENSFRDADANILWTYRTMYGWFLLSFWKEHRNLL